MALVGVGGLLQSILAVGAAVIQAIHSARPGVHEHSWTRHYLSSLRRGQWDLDYVNAKERGVWIFIRRFTRTPGQLFALTDERGSRDIDVDVVLIIRINYKGMRVRAAAGLHRRHLFRIPDVCDIENPYSAETIFLRCRWMRLVLFSSRRRRRRRKTLRPAIESAIWHLHRHKQQA